MLRLCKFLKMRMATEIIPRRAMRRKRGVLHSSFVVEEGSDILGKGAVVEDTVVVVVAAVPLRLPRRKLRW